MPLNQKYIIPKQTLIAVSIIICGFTSVVTQLLFVRDVAAFFVSNELVIGVVFSLWMLLVAAGAFLGRFVVKHKNVFNVYVVLQFLSAVLPLISITALRYFRVEMLSPGLTPGLNFVVLSIVVCLGIFPFVSGLLFTVLCALGDEMKAKTSPSFVYYTETAGSVVGGLLFTFVFVPMLGAYNILSLLLIVNALVLLLWFMAQRRIILVLAALVLLPVSFLPALLDARKASLAPLFPGQQIVQITESAYGTHIVTEMAGQLNFYHGTSLIHSTGDVVAAEEKVHYAMLQHPRPNNVLLISGALSGTIAEAMKYDSVALTYTDAYPDAVSIAAQYNLLSDEATSIHVADPINFFKQSAQYDIVIADVPKPNNVQANRLFTIEFFRLVKAHLADAGIFSTSLGSNPNYMDSDARKLHAIIYNTLKTVFRHVIVIPGGQSYFIASDAPLTFNYGTMYKHHAIETAYVNPYYIDDEALRVRSERFLSSFMQETPLNKAFNPVVPFLQHKAWLNLTGKGMYLLYALIGCIILMALFVRGKLNYAIFAAGFSGTGIELIVILTWQVLFGHVYGSIGLIIAVFMAGMAAGAAFVPRFLKNISTRQLALLQVSMALMAGIFTLLPAFYTGGVVGLGMQVLLFAFIFVFSAFAGAAFSTAVRIAAGDVLKNASSLYTADMLGAALAALLFAIFLIPLAGVVMSCFIITFVNAASVLILLIREKR